MGQGKKTYTKDTKINRHHNQCQDPGQSSNSCAEKASDNAGSAREEERNESEHAGDGVQDHGFGECVDGMPSRIAQACTVVNGGHNCRRRIPDGPWIAKILVGPIHMLQHSCSLLFTQSTTCFADEKVFSRIYVLHRRNIQNTMPKRPKNHRRIPDLSLIRQHDL